MWEELDRSNVTGKILFVRRLRGSRPIDDDLTNGRTPLINWQWGLDDVAGRQLFLYEIDLSTSTSFRG